MPNETDIARLAPARNCQAHVRYTRCPVDMASHRAAQVQTCVWKQAQHDTYEETSQQQLHVCHSQSTRAADKHNTFFLKKKNKHDT